MFKFVEFLTYKAEKIGKRIIRIDESKTTKACCKDRKLKKRVLFERNITCDCGTQVDRHLNAVFNIMTHFFVFKHNYEFLSQ
ncbi:MAG: zinc ribbon domain-containing protein [Promethearchaeota archaeon]